MLPVFLLGIFALSGVAHGGQTSEYVGVLISPPSVQRGPVSIQRAMPYNLANQSPYYYYYRPRGGVMLQPRPEKELVGGGAVPVVLGRSEAPLGSVVLESPENRQYSTYGSYQEPLYSGYGYGYNNPNALNNLPVTYGYPYYYGTTIGYGYGLPQVVGGAGPGAGAGYGQLGQFGQLGAGGVGGQLVI